MWLSGNMLDWLPKKAGFDPAGVRGAFLATPSLRFCLGLVRCSFWPILSDIQILTAVQIPRRVVSPLMLTTRMLAIHSINSSLSGSYLLFF